MSALIYAYWVAMGYMAPSDASALTEACTPVVWVEEAYANSVDQARWDALLAHGWKGSKLDRMEALYYPGCAIVAGQ